MRTFNEIMIEADNTDDVDVLIQLGKELTTNKYNYSLVQLRYADEFIKEKAWKIMDQEVAEIQSALGK
jgi:hypothetical protein